MDLGDVLFATDGRVLAVERSFDTDTAQVTLLDPEGHPLPGWPWTPDRPHDAAATAALGSDGSFWVASRSTGEPEGQSAWWLYRLDDHGQLASGFPVHVMAGSFCELLASRNGDVVMNCETENDTGTPTVSSVNRFAPDGSQRAGWPVELMGSATLSGQRTDGAVLAVYGNTSPWQLTMLNAAGSPVAGWPRSVPGGGIEASVDPQDHVWVTTREFEEDECAPAIRTQYRLLGPDGARLPGSWPVTVKNWASGPLPRTDGGGVVVTEGGHALAWNADGSNAAGWPVSGVDVQYGCGDGSAPVAAGDGDVLVTGGRHATLLGTNGKVPTGWPVGVPGTLAVACPSCTPGSAAPLDPAVGADGVYIPVYRAAEKGPGVVAFSRDGSSRTGWEAPAADAGSEIGWIRIAPNGRVWLELERQGTGENGTPTGVLVPVADDTPLATP
jgi:hypothetical protein